MTPGLVSVLILNWNGGQVVRECLRSVRAQDYRLIEVFVIDNGSTDGSLASLESEAGIRLIKNGRNLGFAAAYNHVLPLTQGEFILLLNNDAALMPDYVRLLVSDMEEDPRRGSASGKLLRQATPNGVQRIDSAGHTVYRNLWSVNRAEDEPDQPLYNQPMEVFGVCAAAALYRRTMLDDVAVDGEIFDASFFAYLEDNDLDWRGRLRGWKSWYDPRAVAIHRRGGTGAWYTTAIQRHILKNRLLMIAKNDAGFPMLRRAPGMLAFTLAKSVQLLVARPAALLGFVDVLRLLPATLHKRRIIQKRRTVAPQTLEPWFQPYPYIQKIREGRLGRSRRPSTSLS